MSNADSVFEGSFHNIAQNTLYVVVQSVLVALVVQWGVVVQCGPVRWWFVIVDIVYFDFMVVCVDLYLLHISAVLVVL